MVERKTTFRAPRAATIKRAVSESALRQTLQVVRGHALPEIRLDPKTDLIPTPDQVAHPWAKPPLRPKHVWSIRTKLQIEGRARDLAMFNLAINSKLRGCDVVAIRVRDVAGGGYTADRSTVRRKTGRPVRFELSEQTRPGGR
jgi:integrase